MTRQAVVAVIATVLVATGLAACSKEPDSSTMSVDSLPPGGAEPDKPRDIPYQNTYSRYSSDRPGGAPRSGMSSDPNNPNGAPGTLIGPR